MRWKKIETGDAQILEMVQMLYGKRWHRASDCFRNEQGNTLITIKNHKGFAQFTLNLTVLSQLKQELDSGFVENHLLTASTDG